MSDNPAEQQNFAYGDSHSINPSIGSIGFSFGGLEGFPASGSYSWEYDGEQWQSGESSLTWGNSFVGIDSEADEWGWSIPLGPLSPGKTYKPDGDYYTATIGYRGVVGLTFEIHEDSPATGMEAAARAFDLLDENGNVVGHEIYVPVGNSTKGWAWHVSRVDLNGQPIAETKIIPMDPQTQKQLSSGFLNDQCFLCDTSVQMWPLDLSIKPRADGSYDEKLVLSKVWYKRQDQIKAGDIVVSPDKWGRLQPGRVARTMTNIATHILDFWGTGVTPGHAYNCADGPFKGGFAPLMDILRTDGVLMRSDGTLFRSTTNCDVGSIGDMMIHAAATLQKPDGTWTEPKAGKVRFGTRIILPDGRHMSFMEMATNEGWWVSDDGYMVAMRKGEEGKLQERKFLFPYVHGEDLPKPEDYILARSAVTLEDIYLANEWEQIGTRMPAPDSLAGFNPNSTMKRTKPKPNIPPAFANRPDAPNAQCRAQRPTNALASPSAPGINRKQRKAMEAKQRKAAKMRKKAAG